MGKLRRTRHKGQHNVVQSSQFSWTKTVQKVYTEQFQVYIPVCSVVRVLLNIFCSLGKKKSIVNGDDA